MLFNSLQGLPKSTCYSWNLFAAKLRQSIPYTSECTPACTPAAHSYEVLSKSEQQVSDMSITQYLQ